MNKLRDANPTNGAGCAAILASAIGVTALGILTSLAAGSQKIANKLALSESVGPLSGKVGLSLCIWISTWLLLHSSWRRREMRFPPVWRLSLALIALGVLLTFPPIFELFH